VDSKLCNFDCIYCECGWNGSVSRPRFGRRIEIRRALEIRLKEMNESNGSPDAITFSGNGEPTMHPEFAEIMSDVVELRDAYAPKAKVCVLSNATFVHREKVFEALRKADRAILKLDGGRDETVERMNCPQGDYSVALAVEKLKAFEGNMILQTMFLRGEYRGQKIDNTSDEEVEAWLKAVKEINPKEITIYSIDRDTPAPDLQKVSKEDLEKIADKARALGYKVQVAG
jgi:wyosine [tRNA(Phe)-imidazoG37] synthetase (radical SAM superfamily)